MISSSVCRDLFLKVKTHAECPYFADGLYEPVAFFQRKNIAVDSATLTLTSLRYHTAAVFNDSLEPPCS